MREGGASMGNPILIVDDDSIIRAAIATILADAGYATREADSGAEALRVARSDAPGLVLLDVNLPGMCGYEVCRLLRDEFGDQFPIVFVSGARTESFDRVAGLLLGANDYISKPFREDELLARVQSLLLRRHAVASRALASRLTARELQVLRLLSTGLGPDDIARLMVISPKTVGAHVEHIYMKLGVQTRAQAVAVAYRGELLNGETAPTLEPSGNTSR
ncbi:MAG: response regulator transcription factor [Chloroflexi bacterium]|nr:MAG: response regulator transcription factor [Chloroflexota bacterium]